MVRIKERYEGYFVIQTDQGCFEVKDTGQSESDLIAAIEYQMSQQEQIVDEELLNA